MNARRDAHNVVSRLRTMGKTVPTRRALSSPAHGPGRDHLATIPSGAKLEMTSPIPVSPMLSLKGLGNFLDQPSGSTRIPTIPADRDHASGLGRRRWCSGDPEHSLETDYVDIGARVRDPECGFSTTDKLARSSLGACRRSATGVVSRQHIYVAALTCDSQDVSL